MSNAYVRPFHPINFSQRTAALFSLHDMIEQLQRESDSRSAKRDALTLLHDQGLTAVLTVARAGAECEDHFSQETTIFIMLEGELAIESALDDGILSLPAGSAGVLARDIRHRLTATTDCAYLMVMACQNKPASAELHRPTTAKTTTGGFVEPLRQAASSGAGPEAVEALVHRLAQSIDAAPARERDELRAYATELLATDVSSQPEERQRSRRPAPFNVAGIALLLVIVALFFLPLLPAVSAILILSAIGIAVVGMLGSLVSHLAKSDRLLGAHRGAS